MEPAQYSIILVDDHIVVRNGLAELIRALGNYNVIAEFNNGQELLDALPLSGNLMPDVILMDLSMPFLDGEQTMLRLKGAGYEIPVLMLTLNTDQATVLRLYHSGARGYLPKDCTAQSLKEAIDDILKRGYYQGEALFQAIMAGEPKPDPFEIERNTILGKFTTKELQFLQLVCNEEEYTYEQIAGLMNLSRRTIDGYRESLFQKLDIKSKTGLVLLAIKYKLLGN